MTPPLQPVLQIVNKKYTFSTEKLLYCATSLSLTNLIVDVHFVDSAQADRGKGDDAVFDHHAVSLEWYDEAYLARNCLGKVALGKLEDREEDDDDDREDREENPVEVVEELKVWSASDNKATVSVSDQNPPKRETSSTIVGVDGWLMGH